MYTVGDVHSMEWRAGAECWSGVLEWSGGKILEWQILGTVLLSGITEHKIRGKIDCSLDPGHLSRCE